MNKTKIKQEIEQSGIIKNFLIAEKNLLFNKIKDYNNALNGVETNINAVHSLIVKKKDNHKAKKTALAYVFLGLKNNAFFLSDKTIDRLKRLNPLKIFFIVPSNDNAYFKIFKNKLISHFPNCIFWYDWQKKKGVKNKDKSITPIFKKFIIFFSSFISKQWFDLSLRHSCVTINFINANWGEDIVQIFPINNDKTPKSNINEESNDEDLKINLVKKSNLTYSIESNLTILLFNWLIQKYFINGQIKSFNQQVVEKDFSIDQENEKEKKLKRTLNSYIINEDLEESNIISINKRKAGQ